MHGPVVVSLTIITFLFVSLLIMWRPKGLQEYIPAIGGALLVLLIGSVSFDDISTITQTISGAAITIISTIVIAMVLESIGFFYWAAEGLAAKAKGSGYRLFGYVNLLCFLMTLFFNNDGSILITTPILIIVLNNFGLKNDQKIPYLLSGALIATASSAPIGVSNIVNLIALKIVGMDLYMQSLLMFVPATLGLFLLFGLLFLVTQKDIPRKLPLIGYGLSHPRHHPLRPQLSKEDRLIRNRLMRNIFIFVFSVRVSLFVASYLGIPVEWVAVTGSALLLGWRWFFMKITPVDILRKTPWSIFVFAFGMYVVIYGLHNIGLTEWLVDIFRPIVSGNLLNASLLMGGLMTLLSSLFNNHPALMIGTLTLTDMNLDPISLKVAYLANVIGSDVGSLLLPIGTLASLIWIHILRQHKVKIGWKEYTRVTFIVIPPTVVVTLILLFYWVSWISKYVPI
ncbi:ArsB/NhaD family transporter [Cohnella luojiensis]|uniref:Arsenic transporter n=1 Tax=Cohnella luojiensis TaxID=652876 RepID=A0A4Y8M552_9BACL|nr:ArsB/NhaD family transporter [Cohnella luojiensis]TFE30049.1 arsenic transporter [Cohnella luojiensis]